MDIKLIRADLAYLGAIETTLRKLDRQGYTARIQDIPGIAPYLTTECPECGENPDDSRNHHIVASPDQTHFGVVHTNSDIVLIGCEGYHVLDPALLGMDREGWDDWTSYL